MNIGLYTPNYPEIAGDGGIGTYIRNQARVLSAMGHEIHVLVPGAGRVPTCDGGVHIHFTSKAHIPVVDRIFPGSGAAWRVGEAAKALARQFSLDVFEFPNWEGVGATFVGKRSVPVLTRLSTSSQETQIIDGLTASRALRREVARERYQAHHSEMLATHSVAHRRVMAEELGIEASRIDVVPLGIETYPDYRRCNESMRPQIVYLGRMERRKGTLDLIHAIPQVLKHVPNAEFILVGADRPHCPGERTHVQYIKDECAPEVARQIKVTGRLPGDQVTQWLQSATLFVAPSLYESFGLIFLEAMRWGTPVIGTRVGGIPEIVEHGHSGLLVSPSNTGELAAAITGLLINPERRRALGEAGRKRVESEFTLSRMAGNIASLYGELVSRRKTK